MYREPNRMTCLSNHAPSVKKTLQGFIKVKVLGALAFVHLFCIEIMILPLFFFDFVNLPPTVSFTKHQFALAPSSTPNGVKLCTKDMNAHVILPLVFMPNYDFAPVWPRLGCAPLRTYIPVPRRTRGGGEEPETGAPSHAEKRPAGSRRQHMQCINPHSDIAFA